MEHLLAGAADFSELMKRCPGVTILATSRAPLNVTGERVYPGSPLSTSNSDPSESGVNPGVSDSARLFLERARVMNPGFNINA
jgi:predicted ATPase